MIQLIRSKFPGATDVAVVDVSGGCGAMYEVYVEAAEFKGLRTLKECCHTLQNGRIACAGGLKFELML